MKNTDYTIEAKARFYAQYWGQDVLKAVKNNGEYGIYTIGFGNNWYNELDYLELKPLSQISDEDAIEVNYLNWEIFREAPKEKLEVVRNLREIKVFIRSGKHIHSKEITEWNNAINAIDYLRSKGYALPWNGISVEEQIELGWIKLK